MRAIRITIALLILSPIFLLAISESRLSVRVLAQVTTLPGPAPLTPPAAPGQPNSFATIGALPSLAPAPGTFRAAIASVQPTPRIFRCTCSAPGYWTEWAGTVAAPSYSRRRNRASFRHSPRRTTLRTRRSGTESPRASRCRCSRHRSRVNARNARAIEQVTEIVARPRLVQQLFQIERERRGSLDVPDRRRVERNIA